jgi:hypothetical protein
LRPGSRPKWVCRGHRGQTAGFLRRYQANPGLNGQRLFVLQMLRKDAACSLQ